MIAVTCLGATPCRRLINAIGIGLLFLLLAWGAGFAWFVDQTSRPAQVPPHVDGIVAFTGGAERVETALRLLAEGRGDKLLLSGIGGGAELNELASLAGVDPVPLAARVTIGRNATTTRGNASETAAWARSNDIHSLLVVTASYHMPRAMTELARALPDAALYSLPVWPVDRSGRPSRPLRLIFEEYMKFLASRTGLTSLLPIREPQPVHGSRVG